MGNATKFEVMKAAPKRILIIRLSSIGDIILTTPIPRVLKAAFPDAVIHYVCKMPYEPLLLHNPYVDKVHLLDGDMKPLIAVLKREQYDVILDLHKNIRSGRIKRSLSGVSYSFDKLNYEKLLLTKLKVNKLPEMHIVDRYAEVLAPFGLSLDKEGLELYIPDQVFEMQQKLIREHFDEQPIAVVIGAKFATKKWITAYFPELINSLGLPVLLIGGKEDGQDAKAIEKQLKVPVLNSVGSFGLLESAALLKACRYVIAHDTGFMHIAAAFKMKIFSLWGNTVPAFGMYPYQTEHYILETNGLSCRPCSKIGYEKCPKGHFDCMRLLTPEKVLEVIRAHT